MATQMRINLRNKQPTKLMPALSELEIDMAFLGLTIDGNLCRIPATEEGADLFGHSMPWLTETRREYNEDTAAYAHYHPSKL